MGKIKVMLACRPKMLGEIIKGMVQRQPDMEVVGEVLDPIELLLAIRTSGVDALIVTPLDLVREPKICRHLLAEAPQLKIATLSTKGQVAFLYETGSHRQRIDKPSEPSILGAIRKSIHRSTP